MTGVLVKISFGGMEQGPLMEIILRFKKIRKGQVQKKND